MKASDIIQDLRAAIVTLRQKKETTLPLDRLESYLNEIEPATQSDSQKASQEALAAQRNFEFEMEKWKTTAPQIMANNAARAVEMFKSVIEAGLNALKAAMIMNGSASVALLAFLGGILTDSSVDKTQDSLISFALLIFLFGTGFAGAASGVRYLSQACFSNALGAEFAEKPILEKRWELAGNSFNLLAILLGVGSYAAFFYGGWSAYRGILN